MDSVAHWSRPACAARADAGRMNVFEAARNPSWMELGRMGLCMLVNLFVHGVCACTRESA